MKIVTAENCGFCFGVQNAVNTALRAAEEYPNQKIYTLGKLIHNERVTEDLRQKGVLEAASPADIETGATVIIRSHGVGKDVFDALKAKNARVIDATCPFVKKIQGIAAEYYRKGYQIIILGEPDHPEVTGINGWCDGRAIVINSVCDAEKITGEKICVVAQTTFDTETYDLIIKKIQKQLFKSVEIFDTICYTTYKRQKEAAEISRKCDVVLVLGSRKSSNTAKLFEICKRNCGRCYLLETAQELQNITFKAADRIGIAAGASTPPELIGEVKDSMAQQFNDEINDVDFKEAMEESPVSLREGKRVKGTVISADEKGITVNIGLKNDGYIAADEAGLSDYNPAEFAAGTAVEAVVVSTQKSETGFYALSKKKVDAEKEGNKQVEAIRNGEVFELKMEKETKGGLLSKIGSYTVFVPVSQVRERFVTDLKSFAGKTLRLTVLEIDDQKHKIVASAKKVIEAERNAREEVFWSNVRPDVIVSGTVKSVTDHGVFVSVDGFDCKVHMKNISWRHMRTAADAAEILKVGNVYDFLVLSVDRENRRVSLSYKLLQPDPLETFLEKYPVGSVTKGKVIKVEERFAIVALDSGDEGFVHVSQAAHQFVKSMTEVIKVGDETDVKVLKAEMTEKEGRKFLKVTLSIKECKPEEAPVDAPKAEPAEGKPAKQKSKKKSDGSDTAETGWNEEAQNNPFAELLQGLDMDKDKE